MSGEAEKRGEVGSPRTAGFSSPIRVHSLGRGLRDGLLKRHLRNLLENTFLQGLASHIGSWTSMWASTAPQELQSVCSLHGDGQYMQ